MKPTKLVGVLSVIAGIIMIVAGAITWGMVSSQLKAENITVPGDSTIAPGKPVQGPITAYAQADIMVETGDTAHHVTVDQVIRALTAFLEEKAP